MRRIILNNREEGLRVIISPELSDRLYIFSAEYSVSADFLVNTAIKRLIDDIDFARDLRAGKIKEP